jgi:hypothetical protein
MPNAPRLFPLTVAMGVLVWIIATSGGNHVLVKEWLGEAHDFSDFLCGSFSGSRWNRFASPANPARLLRRG